MGVIIFKGGRAGAHHTALKPEALQAHWQPQSSWPIIIVL